MNVDALGFTEAEVRELLGREEGQFLEFKSVWDQQGPRRRHLERRHVRDTIAEYVAAFANADGGVLLVGVEDDGSPSGHDYPEEAVAAFFHVPVKRLRPPVKCRTARILIDGHEILVFDVPMSPEAVMVGGDGFPYRVADQTIREPQEVINRRKNEPPKANYASREGHVQPMYHQCVAIIMNRYARICTKGNGYEPVLTDMHREGRQI